MQDNRDFYRIQDDVLLEYEVLTPDEFPNADDEFPLPVPPEFVLLNDLHSIENENAPILRSISEKDRNIANYLKSIDLRLELLGRALIRSKEDQNATPQRVTLSEGGISFNNKKPLPLESYLAMKLFLLPSYIGLLLYGRVVNCNESIKGDYLINLVFEQLTEQNRHLLARHVLQHQAKMRRKGLVTAEIIELP